MVFLRSVWHWDLSWTVERHYLAIRVPSLKTLELKYNLGVVGNSLVDVRPWLGKQSLRILLETHVTTANERPRLIAGC